MLASTESAAIAQWNDRQPKLTVPAAAVQELPVVVDRNIPESCHLSLMTAA